IKHLKLEVPLEKFVCCTQCYSLYNVETAPEECTYQATFKSARCGAELFRISKFKPLPHIQFPTKQLEISTKKNKYPHIQLPNRPRLKIPYATFIAQPLLTWITWLLNRTGIEDAIEQWVDKLSAAEPGLVCDVAQGEVWKKLFQKRNTDSDLHLGFSLFIDWFNPAGNKASGKQTSMGIIALNCLNIPPRLRNQPQYTCLAGMIPSPNQPDMNTMNNVLMPLVTEMAKLNHGVMICTSKHPKGRKVVIKLVNLIGDIVANHKVAGFKSHAARKFCSWCEVEDHERGNLELGRLRSGREVVKLAVKWKELASSSLRDQLAKKTGVRWSELNGLSYWDPVVNVPLGVMHNWYEGVLQHHFRYCWGFDMLDVRRQMLKASTEESEDSENYASSDGMELDDEE
ncbi:hypothetical protein O181_130500, partial [Austropuccinia psidii MF-1]|nr:hypothetical protein [Austropuccinia psidii MF-1]